MKSVHERAKEAVQREVQAAKGMVQTWEKSVFRALDIKYNRNTLGVAKERLAIAEYILSLFDTAERS
jgi:hypothetical protein